jgi:hypothetical protein
MTEVWAVVIAAVVSACVGLVMVYYARRKGPADVAKVLTEATLDLSESYKDRIKEKNETIHFLALPVDGLEEKHRRMEQRYRELRAGVLRLHGQMRELGHTLLYKPPDD